MPNGVSASSWLWSSRTGPAPMSTKSAPVAISAAQNAVTPTWSPRLRNRRPRRCTITSTAAAVNSPPTSHHALLASRVHVDSSHRLITAGHSGSEVRAPATTTHAATEPATTTASARRLTRSSRPIGNASTSKKRSGRNVVTSVGRDVAPLTVIGKHEEAGEPASEDDPEQHCDRTARVRGPAPGQPDPGADRDRGRDQVRERGSVGRTDRGLHASCQRSAVSSAPAMTMSADPPRIRDGPPTHRVRTPAPHRAFGKGHRLILRQLRDPASGLTLNRATRGTGSALRIPLPERRSIGA